MNSGKIGFLLAVQAALEAPTGTKLNAFQQRVMVVLQHPAPSNTPHGNEVKE